MIAQCSGHNYAAGAAKVWKADLILDTPVNGSAHRPNQLCRNSAVAGMHCRLAKILFLQAGPEPNAVL